MTGEYMTVAEFAAATGKTTQSIYKGKQYKPYMVRIGGKTMVLRAALEAFTTVSGEQPTVDNISTEEITKQLKERLQSVDNSTKSGCATVENQPQQPTVATVDNPLIEALRAQIEELKADKVFLQGQIAELNGRNAELNVIIAQSQKLLAASTAAQEAPQDTESAEAQTPTEEAEQPTTAATDGKRKRWKLFQGKKRKQ